MTVVVAVVVLVVALATYVTWTAQRLDRLHARVDLSAAALDSQLVRRAAAAAAFAAAGSLPPGASEALSAAAREAAAGEGLGHDREVVENSLSRALHAAMAAAPEAFEGDAPVVANLRTATTKTTFARRFHNDAVRDTLVVRRRRVPRLLRLPGSAPLPAYFEIDDTALPPVAGSTRPLG
jgi:hypothetical protein